MANGRNKLRKGDTGREAGGFVALPWSVLDSPAFQGLSHPARSLLLELARQFVRDNNGRLLASLTQLKDRGWSSNDTITRALRELLGAGLVFQTVQGQRPNRASWYAITWRNLDRHAGYDTGAVEGFRRGAYRGLGVALQAPIAPSRGVVKNTTLTPSGGAAKNAVLTPSGGDIERPIAPPHGVSASAIAPPDGAIRGDFGGPPTPPDGDHLEIPSTWSEATGPKVLDCMAIAAPATQENRTRPKRREREAAELTGGAGHALRTTKRPALDRRGFDPVNQLELTLPV